MATAARSFGLTLGILAAAASALPGCSDTAKKKDTGEVTPQGGPLALKGIVASTNAGAALPGVTVTARCGASVTNVPSNDFGEYSIAVPGTGCDRLVMTFEKESFRTVVRTLPLPTTRSQIDLDLHMAPLTEIICGQTACGWEGGGIAGGLGLFARGWGGGFGGQADRGATPGEDFDDSGRPLLVLAGHEYDFRDASGQKIATFATPSGTCHPLDPASYDELQDARPSEKFPGATHLEVPLYQLDLATGRWMDTGQLAEVHAGAVDDEDILRTKPYLESDLGDIRRGKPREIDVTPDGFVPPDAGPDGEDGGTTAASNKLMAKEVYLCAPVPGSGIYAIAYPQEGKGCVVADVVDGCDKPDDEAKVETFGRDRSFYNWGFTTGGGQACIVTPRSEAIGEVQTLNGVQGETFWVDLSVTSTSGTVNVDALALPVAEGSCATPDTCVHISIRTGTGCSPVADAAPQAATDAGLTDGDGTIRIESK